MKQESLLTKGSVLSALLRFSVPFLIANIIQALYGAVDLMVIGKYCSAESVAAVSTGTQVTQIIISLISGLTLGGTIIVGKYTGMGLKEDTRKAIGTIFSAFIIFSLMLTALLIIFAEPILIALKTPPESLGLAKEYVRICASGILFTCGYNGISAVLRGYGDSTRPMMLIAFACVLHIIGDVVAVKYLGMGVRGVALATILAQGISMICAIIYLNRRKFFFTFTLSSFRIDREKLRELLRVGVPITLQECMVRLSFLYLTAIVNRLGVHAAAAVGVASKYDVFAMLPAVSVAGALAAFTAQNYGAGKPQRAKKALWAGLTFAVVASGGFFLWAQLSPQTMIGAFIMDPDIIRQGIPFFRSCSYDYLVINFVFCLNGYLNGRGQTLFTMMSCCAGALLLRMPIIYLVFRFYPNNMAVIGMAAPLVSGIMAVYTLIYVIRQASNSKGEVVI